MALTLTEGAKLSNDVLLQGVIETIVKDSPILQVLPFQEIVGNAITYNRENVPATAAFYTVGDTWDEDTPSFTQVTTSLKIMGGDADVDQYLARTRNNVNDLEAEVIALKAKAVQHTFEDAFITGDVGSDPNSFDGLQESVPAGQTVTNGTDGAELSLEVLDEMIDLHRGGPPDLILMSRRTRRALNVLSRGDGAGVLSTDRNEFGNFVTLYSGIRVAVSDFIPDDETVGLSSDCSSIYGLRFGAGALAGLTGPGGLQVEPIGALETKDAHRFRVKWYTSIALYSDLAVSRVTGVRPAA